MATVSTGARLHAGFQNLSLAHPRLYGGVGIGLATPRVVVEADTAGEFVCENAAVEPYLHLAAETLEVPGATVTVHERFDRHVGLGSGTQIALAVLVALARAYDRQVDPRDLAPALGRGGRSGVGVATFERGGFVVDAGHHTRRFTADPPETGDWTVPEPLLQRSLPETWRFLLVVPEGEGLSGPEENSEMRAVSRGADPGIADDVAVLLTRELLPAVAEGDLESFGAALTRLGRLNGAWYADTQGGIYRPPAGRIAERLDDASPIAGVGQSSWGPTVYGVTEADRADRAREAGERALAETDITGSVQVVRPSTHGAVVEDTPLGTLPRR